jgi:hypothetical protein
VLSDLSDLCGILIPLGWPGITLTLTLTLTCAGCDCCESKMLLASESPLPCPYTTARSEKVAHQEIMNYTVAAVYAFQYFFHQGAAAACLAFHLSIS